MTRVRRRVECICNRPNERKDYVMQIWVSGSEEYDFPSKGVESGRTAEITPKKLHQTGAQFQGPDCDAGDSNRMLRLSRVFLLYILTDSIELNV
jgi:hypothetical protein